MIRMIRNRILMWFPDLRWIGSSYQPRQASEVVNVGVIGRTGVGKSTFINAYRGIEFADEEGAAPVGVIQTTMEATPYPDPNNPNIVLYDVPGVGTKEFPRDTYLTNPTVGIDKYDFAIIITSTRFCEDEIWLYAEIVRMGKPVFWVRTKVLQDVRNEKCRKKESKDKTDKEVIEGLIGRYKSEMKLRERVYFIDSHEPDHPNLDFDELLADIVNKSTQGNMTAKEGMKERIKVDSPVEKESMQHVKESLEATFREGGVEAVKQQVNEMQDGWKSVLVNVGVIGRTGVGKSTFINAYRNIEIDDDAGAAPVGVTETTMEATPYPDPNNPNIVLWDCPGVGTETFPRSTYLTNPKVGIDKYDFAIIITSIRFCEEDLWLYGEMVRMGKPVFWVKTKVMEDVRNEKRQKVVFKDKTEKEVIEALIGRYKSEMKLREKVYFIDSIERDHPNLEFDDLLTDIVNKLTQTKAEAVLFSLRVYGPNLISEKVKRLKRRRWFIGILSGAMATIPVPGVSAAVDFGIITAESIFYRNQLGLERKSLLRGFKKRLAMNAASAILSSWKVIGPKLIGSFIVAEGVENVTRLAIPIIGSFIAAGISYGSTVYTLNKILDAMAEDAKKINELIIEDMD